MTPDPDQSDQRAKGREMLGPHTICSGQCRKGLYLSEGGSLLNATILLLG